MKPCRPCAGALILVLAACGSLDAGGRGSGGAGGTDEPENVGVTAPVPVELSFVSFAIQTQVWTATLNDRPTPSGLQLVLQEEAGGCAVQGSERIGPGPHAFAVRLNQPAVGDCPDTSWYEATGCTSSVELQFGSGRGIAPWMVLPSAWAVRIDRLDAALLRGELRATFPVDPEWQAVWDGQEYCLGMTGAMRECEVPGEDCCNAGKPLEEVVVPFEAMFCAAAAPCYDPRHCAAIEAAAACPVPAVDCEASCEGYATACFSCDAAQCEGDSWCEDRIAEQCAWMVEPCAADCAATRDLPLASIGLACLATATCDDWLSCLESCGGAR